MNYCYSTESEEIKRGQVYYIRVDAGIGSMQGIGRPVAVISSDFGCQNADIVTVAYLTSSPKRMKMAVEVHSTGRPAWVLCNQIITVDKQMLERKIGVLTDEELSRVDEALSVSLGLKAFEKETEGSKQPSADTTVDTTELRLERDTYKRLYEKTLERFAELIIKNDISVKPKTPTIVKKQPSADTTEVNAATEKVNVNLATKEDLITRCGINEVTARQIISYRNKNGSYHSLEELLNVQRFGPLCLKKYSKVLTV